MGVTIAAPMTHGEKVAEGARRSAQRLALGLWHKWWNSSRLGILCEGFSSLGALGKSGPDNYHKYVNALRRKTGSQKVSQHPSSNTAEGTLPQQHYSVPHKARAHLDLYTLSTQCISDPALKVSTTASQRTILY